MIHDLIREIQAIAQTGLHYTKDPYDEERYHRLREIAFAMMAELSDLATADFAKFFLPDSGYATPKVDLRMCVFQNDQVLLVKERADGRWTLPGGWADQNETPKEGIVREAFEESGYKIRVDKLYAIKERRNWPYVPQYPIGILKLFFLGTIIGGEAKENLEVSEIQFFDVNELPPLSIDRTLAEDITLGLTHLREPHLQPYID